MNEPIKLPPFDWHYLVDQSGVEDYATLAVEQATADLRERLRVSEETLARCKDVLAYMAGEWKRTEAERDEALAHAESAEAGQSDAGFVGLKVMQERDEARAELARLTELLSDVRAVEAELAEKSDELARLTTLRPVSEWKEGDVVFWELYGPAGYARWRHSDAFHASHWTPLPDVKEANP
jgi:hypothetical protein